MIENEAWTVAKDICDILDLSDVNKTLEKLDNDEKLTRKIFVSGQNRKMWLVNESGLYALIMRSNKPEAKAFRKWVTSEVLPAIRKKGYYGMQQHTNNYLDARDIPFFTKSINGYNVRCIELKDGVWVVINDANKAIHSSTGSNQLAKKLNARQQLAKKIWLFGNTHPAWCTNQLGLELLLAGSRKFSNQLNLAL
jgi:prophage antirepressor-like protein